MKKIILFALVCCTVFLLGCKDDDNPVKEKRRWDEWPTCIEVRVSTNELTAPTGVVREVEVTAIACNAAGVGVPDAELTLSVIDGIGEIIPQTGVTDEIGRVFAYYSTIIPTGRSTVKLSATIGQVYGEKQLTINGVNPPASIGLIPETSELTVSRNTNGSINLVAVVTDSSGAGVQGARVKFQISEFHEETPVFGSISGSNITDENGRAEAVFRSDLGSGTVKVIVFVDETGYENMFAQVPLTVRIIPEEPHAYDIRIFPQRILPIHPDSLTTTNIAIFARDKNNVGIPNLRFRMICDIGALTGSFLTDDSGVLSVQHSVRPSTDVGHDGNFTVTILAELPGFDWSETIELPFKVEKTNGSLTLISDCDFIWADGAGGEYATLTAILKDNDGQVISGKEIVFSTSFQNCVVQSPVTTDSMGIARAVFDDNGEPSVNERGMPIPVVITARYPEMGIEESVEISIREIIRVARIDVNASRRQLTANGTDSMEVRVTCYMNNGSPAPSDTEIHFYAKYGRWLYDVATAGASSNVYFAPDFSRIDSCYIYVINPTDTVYYYLLIDILSGPPEEIDVTAEPDQIPAGSNTLVTVNARVTDSYGNPVRQGTYVSFSSSQGGNDQSANTDLNGISTAQFSVYGSLNSAFITATVDGPEGPIDDTVEIETIGGTPSRIGLELDPDVISIAGVGGNSISTVRTSLFDQNDDPVLYPTPVILEIAGGMGHPQGPAFFYENRYSQAVEVTSVNGIAESILHAGTIMQDVEIRAFTFADDERQDTLRALSQTLRISGLPHFIDVYIDGTGSEVGNGYWSLDVSIDVSDINQRPFDGELPVTFVFVPDIATMESVTTGNPDWEGNCRPGRANATLVYHGSESLAHFELTTSIRTPLGEVNNTTEHTLPLQKGELELNIDPANWMFREGQEIADIRVWAVLNDGQGVPINNVPILFTSTRARFWWMDLSTGRYIMFFPGVSRKLTGIVDRQNNEESGTATVYLRAMEPDIFLDRFGPDVQVFINATVEGHDDISVEPGIIWFTRPNN